MALPVASIAAFSAMSFAPVGSTFGPHAAAAAPNRLLHRCCCQRSEQRPVPAGRHQPRHGGARSTDRRGSRAALGSGGDPARSPLPEHDFLLAGKRCGSCAQPPPWAGTEPEQAPGRRVPLGPSEFRRVLLQVQPAPAAADRESPRSRPPSPPQGLGDAHQAPAEPNNSNRTERICRISAGARSSGHCATPDPGPEVGGQVERLNSVCLGSGSARPHRPGHAIRA